MSTILQSPDSLSFSGNLKKFIVSAATTVDFLLMQGETEILSASYMPGVSGLVEIDLKEIIDRLLTISVPVDGGAVTSQLTAVGNFTATIDTVETEFTVIKGGVLGLQELASEFVDDHFLTWQSQEKKILQYQPEWLTLYATAERVVKCKAYYLDEGSGSGSGGVSHTGNETVTLSTVSEGRMDTIDVSWGAICDAITAQNPVVWDVWFENAGGTRLSYIQRYQLRNVTSEENMFVWVNTLGGVDAVSFTGSAEKDRKIDHKVLELYDESLEEYQEDKKQEVKQSTGFLSSQESLWLEDFFYSRKRYLVDLDGSLVPVVVVSSQVVSSTADDMFDYEFNYRMAADANLLNMDRVTSDLPAPEGLSDFFLFELLSALPVATYQPNLEFAVQSPFAAGWMKLSFSELWGGALPGLVDGTTIQYNNGKLRTTANAQTATRKPKHGFESNTDNIIAYLGGTFSITFVPVEESGSGGETPTGFNVWRKGEMDERGSENISVPVVPGVASDWFVYYDTELELTVTESPWNIFEHVTICTIRYDGYTAVITDHRHPVNAEWDELTSELWSPASDSVVAFTTNSAFNVLGNLRVVTAGSSTSLVDDLFINHDYSLLQTDGNEYGYIYNAIGNNKYSSWQVFLKSRSVDGKEHGAIQLGDGLGDLCFMGDDGYIWSTAAKLNITAHKGIIYNGSSLTIPGQFSFWTQGDVSGGDRFVINESGTKTTGRSVVLVDNLPSTLLNSDWNFSYMASVLQYDGWDSYGPIINAIGDNAYGGSLIFSASRSPDGINRKTLEKDDIVGYMEFWGDDGYYPQLAGGIYMYVMSTPTQNRMHSGLYFDVRSSTTGYAETVLSLTTDLVESTRKIKSTSIQLTTGAAQWRVLTDKVGAGDATWEPLQKTMIEGVLTGNITSHTHSQYLTSSSLSGYATQTWVGDQGYVTGSPWTSAGYWYSGSHPTTLSGYGITDAAPSTTVSFPGFGTTHALAAYGDHTHSGYQATITDTSWIEAQYLEARNGVIVGDYTNSASVQFYLSTITARRTIQLPNASGVLALTSDFEGKYLLLSGGTLTGSLSGTSISMSGTITGSEVYRGSSREIKTNIVDYNQDALRFLNDVSIKQYNLKANGLFGIGFIAEDTHEWLSGANKKSHIFGNHLGILTKAIQDEDKKVEDLKVEIQLLQKQVKELQDARRQQTGH